MTTLTLRCNLYDKTLEPALRAEPESIAVGETVKLRLLGLGFGADDMPALNAVLASDAVTPPLRARMRNDSIGDIAIFPFPGDDPSEGNGWYAETVDGETATCCNLDLGTAQAYGLFGGAPQPDGVRRKVRLIIERSFPNDSPTLYASDMLTLGSWSFPGHELRFLGQPKGTDITQDDLQAALDNAASGFKAELLTRAEQIAAAMSGVTEETISGLRDALQSVTAEDVSGIVASGLSGYAKREYPTIEGSIRFENNDNVNGFSGGCYIGAEQTQDEDGSRGVIVLGGEKDPEHAEAYIGSPVVDEGRIVTVGMLSGEVASGIIGRSFADLKSGLENFFGVNINSSGDFDWRNGNPVASPLSGALSTLGIGSISNESDFAAILEAMGRVASELSDRIDSLNPGGASSFCELVENCIGNRLSGIEDQISGLASASNSVTNYMSSITSLLGSNGGGTDAAILTRLRTLESAVAALQSGSGTPSGSGEHSGSGTPDDSGTADPPFAPPLTPPIA